MKKMIVFSIALLFLFGSVSLGHARFEREETNVGWVKAKATQSDLAITSGPAYVYAVTVYANAANSFVNLHDATSASIGTHKVEVGEATQYETKRYTFNPPIKFSTAVYADVTSGSVVVEYR